VVITFYKSKQKVIKCNEEIANLIKEGENDPQYPDVKSIEIFDEFEKISYN